MAKAKTASQSRVRSLRVALMLGDAPTYYCLSCVRGLTQGSGRLASFDKDLICGACSDVLIRSNYNTRWWLRQEPRKSRTIFTSMVDYVHWLKQYRRKETHNE